MREIIERDGKFYVKETVEVGQITLKGLRESLSKLKAEKARVLRQESDTFEKQITEVEGQIAALKKVQEEAKKERERRRKAKVSKK